MQTSIVVKFKTYRINFEKVQENNDVRKTSKTASMPVHQSSSLYEDLSMLTSLAVADFFIIVNKTQVAVHFVTMFLTVAGTCQSGAQVCTKS